jgi:ATP-dependent DNA helicase RecQ
MGLYPMRQTMDAPSASAGGDEVHDEMTRVLQRVWGYAAFRGPQRAAIRATLAGDDVLVVMATGGGKSLCCQV